MSDNFEINLSTYYSEDFSEGELRLLKQCFRDAYHVLKRRLDKKPRYKRPFNSCEAYKMHKAAIMYKPIDYYRFKDDYVDIFLDYRSQGCFYTVGVTGTKFVKFSDKKVTSDSFSAGYDFYGHFNLSDYTSAVAFWRECVFNYLQGKKLDIHFVDIDEKIKKSYRSVFHV